MYLPTVSMVHNPHYSLLNPSSIDWRAHLTVSRSNNCIITSEAVTPALGVTVIAVIGPWSCNILPKTRIRRGDLKYWQANGLLRPLVSSLAMISALVVDITNIYPYTLGILRFISFSLSELFRCCSKITSTLLCHSRLPVGAILGDLGRIHGSTL
jgi:hypothetical protein